jgi:hypothetical protein
MKLWKLGSDQFIMPKINNIDRGKGVFLALSRYFEA